MFVPTGKRVAGETAGQRAKMNFPEPLLMS